LLSVAEQLAAEVGDEVRERPKSNRAPVSGTFRLFDEANRISTIAVLDRLSIAHTISARGEMATCPGCGEEGALVCNDGGLKCLHARCADAGPRANPGFRTNVDLVMCAEQMDKVSAAKQLCVWFGIEVPSQAAADTETPPDEPWEPLDSDAPDAAPEPNCARKSQNPAAWPALDAAAIFARIEPVQHLLGAFDICPGAPTLFAGVGFSGKTVASQSLALSVAAGTKAWGSYPVRRGRVLHPDYEQGKHLSCTKYQRLAAPMMIGPADIADRLVLVPMPQIYLDSPAAEAFYEERCKGFDLVIIDSLRAACPSMEVLDMLNRVSGKTGACFVVIHHARKPQKDSPGGARASIRGSGAIFDACGSVLVFDGSDKGEPVRVTHEKARTTGRLADDFLLRIEDQEIDGHARAGLTVTAEAVSEASPARESGKGLDALKERVRAFFRENGDQPSANVVRARLGVNRDALYAVMAELKQSGEVVNTGTEKTPNLHLQEVGK
jgi:hypothetical protein